MKKAKLIIATITLSAAMSMMAFAGEWKQDSNGWWYQNDDGSYPKNCWQTINGKQYYFNESGYTLANTTTPDGKQVGADGAQVGTGGAQVGTGGAQVQTPLFDFDLDNCHVKYTKHELTTDYEGNPCIILYYDYTNKSNKAESALASDCYITAYQNGVECDEAIISVSNTAIDNYYKNIMPGITLNVAEAFKISDKSSVTLTLEDLWDWSSDQKAATAVINLK